VKARARSVRTFGGTAAVIVGAAGLARVVCPGGCQTCETCVAAVAPLGGAVLAVGGVVAASLFRRKDRASEEEAKEEKGGAEVPP
jgi:hypothetical protein